MAEEEKEGTRGAESHTLTWSFDRKGAEATVEDLQ